MKATKEDARYTDSGTALEHCGICRYFRPPRGCARIEGVVRAGGWCKFFFKLRRR